jgi:hypothetical protein
MNISIAWNRPLTRQGGGNLIAGHIANYLLRNAGDGALVETFPGSALSGVVTNAAPGAYSFTLTAVDTNSQPGTVSPPFSITVPSPVPPPPTEPTNITIGLS